MRKFSLIFAMMLCGLSAMMAQRTVTGIITDEAGEPLIGASVFVPSSSTGTVTDIDGRFSIDLPDGINSVSVSYTGFETKLVELGVSNTIDIILAESTSILDEVVVTGYSSQERRKLVSAVSTVGNEKLENQALTDVNQLIQGNAAGVFTSAQSGQPGAFQAVRIRGTGSVTGGRGPLYVIDGIIIESGNFASLDSGNNPSDILANLNPNDIESVTVLKDASATALYGSRGANGVILITTKRGKAGKTSITAKAFYGNTQPLFGNFEMMNAQQQWDYERQILANGGATPAEIDEVRPQSFLDNTEDWVDAAFRNGEAYNMELQASGGNEKTRFFASAGYNRNEGVLIESDFDRTSLRANVDHNASDKLKFDLSFNSTYSQQGNAVNGNRFASPLLGAFLNSPMQGSRNPQTGELYTGLEDESQWFAFIGDNFLYSQPINYVDVNTFRLLSKIGASYTIADGLQFTQNANIDFASIDSKVFQDPTTNDGFNNNGNISQAYVKLGTVTTQSLLKYFTEFEGGHNLNVLGGFEYQQNRFENFTAAGRGLASGKLQTLNSVAEADGVPSGSNSGYTFVSYLSSLNYDYNNKYLLTASFRRDGSSRFPESNRWANFWSVGAAWNMHQEGFLSGVNGLTNLKLRASYGTSGNADIGNFPNQELYSFDLAYLGSPASRPSQIGNDNLTWETSQTFNLGLDFGFLNDRIGGTVEVYRRISQDLLFDVPVSSTSGFTSATQNIGELQNQGVEATIFLVPVKAKQAGGFNWTFDFNMSVNRNEILTIPDGEDILPGNLQLYREGEPIRTFFMQEWAGVNPDDGTPLWRTEEGTTGTYNQAERFIVGNAEPQFIAGLTNKFSFKGITLSAFFYTAQGHKIYNSSRRFVESDGQRFGWNHIVQAADAWQQPGDIAERPQPLQGGNNAANANSSRFLEDGSFIRLRNATLGYTLPSAAIDALNLERVYFYINGTNLWTQTDYSGFDPEADEDGNEFFRYPVGRVLTFGVDVTF